MTNAKNKLRHTGVKVTAWVLLFVTLFAAAGGTVLTAEMQEYGLYAAALQKKEKISYIGTSYWENHFLSMTARVEEMAQAIVHLEQQEELYLTDVMDNPDWTPQELLPEKDHRAEMQDPWGNTVHYSNFVDNYINWTYYDTLPDVTNFRYRIIFSTSNGIPLVLETPRSGDAEAFRFPEDAVRLRGEDYTITVAVDESFPVRDEFSIYAAFAQDLFPYRWITVTVAAAGWMLSLVLALILLVSSGKRPDTDEIALTVYDRIPFDLLLCVVVTAVVCGFGFGGSFAFGGYYGYRGGSNSLRLVLGTVGTLMMSGSVWLGLLTLASLITRARAHTLWSNNILVRCVVKIWSFCKKHLGWAFRKLWHGVKYGVQYIVAGGAARIGLVIVLGALFASALLSFLFAVLWQEPGIFVWSLFLLIFWAGSALVALGQMVTLDKGAKELAAGDLQHKIETEKLWIGFKGHAENINAIAEGMNAAVEHRMKSERLKTELLTNVSHDIKTPLTSIINYVDLLQSAEDDEHAQEYLEVLDRQSKRLKKLLEDLIEASKASTGNIRAELVPTDVSELLRQAAGEYEARFSEAKLTPIITLPAGATTVLADGRLLWRMFDNMLNNIVKYSLAGTRVYLAVESFGDDWRVTFKNISREPLNITADELMERFVRGDTSRATEGSGLGLSIARSLADCMHADFSLSIDGDLFRAAVSLPKHEA